MAVPNTTNSEASVLDIVSFGYRQAFKNLLQVSKLALPTIIIGMILGVLQVYQSRLSPRDPQQIMLALAILPLVFVNMYNYYCASRYARDRYFDEVQNSIFSYWIPNSTLVKVILLGLLGGLAFIPMSIVGLIGIVLLILPGVVWFTYFFTAYNLIFAILLDKPDFGVIGSVKEGFRLMKDNLVRTIGLGLLTGLINFIIYFPVSFLKGMLQGAGRLLHSDAASMGILGLSAALNGVMSWLAITVGLCGTLFVAYRYISDLKVRHGDLDASGYNGDPSNLPPGSMFGINR